MRAQIRSGAACIAARSGGQRSSGRTRGGSLANACARPQRCQPLCSDCSASGRAGARVAASSSGSELEQRRRSGRPTTFSYSPSSASDQRRAGALDRVAAGAPAPLPGRDVPVEQLRRRARGSVTSVRATAVRSRSPRREQHREPADHLVRAPGERAQRRARRRRVGAACRRWRRRARRSCRSRAPPRARPGAAPRAPCAARSRRPAPPGPRPARAPPRRRPAR